MFQDNQKVGWKMGSTLQIHLPLGQTIIVMLLLLVASELIFRLPVVEEILPIPSFGGSNPFLDEKIILFNKRAEVQLPLTCVFIGSSRIHNGFDPAIQAQSFAANAGYAQDCFNFGIPGFRPTSLATLSNFLIQECHPRTLLVGIDNFALTLPPVTDDINIDWVRYHLNQFSASGFIIENFHVYRYYLKGMNWNQYDRIFLQKAHATLGADEFHDGFAQAQLGIRAGMDLEQPPDIYDPTTMAMQNFQIMPEQIAALNNLAALNANGTQVIVVLTPWHPSFALHLPHGETDLNQATTLIKKLFSEKGVPVWDSQTDVSIPTDGWFDRSHLNAVGTAAFSAWVGNKLSEFEKHEASPIGGNSCHL
jgi:hypothetical protein